MINSTRSKLPATQGCTAQAASLATTAALWILLACLASTPATAHQPSDSYLQLQPTDPGFSGRWDIDLLDLELALGLDGDGDGVLTWGEVRHQHGAIANYAFAHLSLTRGGQPCDLTATQQAITRHNDAPYSVLEFRGQCPTAGTLAGSYDLFFDLDPSHRGLLRVASRGAVHSSVLSPGSRQFQLGDPSTAMAATVTTYFREGVVHIWGGFDHVLFLLTLLLPAVLLRSQGQWLGVTSFRRAGLEVVKIVTAFTLAHSLTLAVAVLDWVHLPSRFVESTIALTVVLAALNNLRPVVRGKVWGLAFILGLIHGFGFAGVLAEMDLPKDALAVALASFNVGVEAGQLAIVAVFLPLAFLLRKTWIYQRVVYTGGSLAVASLAFFWLWERSFMVS